MMLLDIPRCIFLRNVLIGIFIVGTGIVIFISVFLSNKISKPITALAEQLNLFKLSGENKTEIETDISSFEVKHLADRFNELLRRTNESFEFQKHTVNHISHQLKTPIAVLVSELEKIKGYSNIDAIKCDIESQINKTKSLGSIINALLEISKIESGQEIKRAYVRIDELIFDIIDEINTIFPDFHFEVNYTPDEIEENNLLLNVNEMLIRQAFHNLLINCITYSNNSKAEIKFDCTSNNQLKIVVANTGKQVSSDEKKYLFNHFFRGKNSKGKIGFGLGLVLAKKIITISSGTITYSTPSENLNLFEVRFPLS
jgi:two-component system, OmpR family, sensor histidine kinase ArlS